MLIAGYAHNDAVDVVAVVDDVGGSDYSDAVDNPFTQLIVVV